MPRTAAFAVENQFAKGLLTEFTGLNFPEQAATDALNVIFDNKGAVLRRPGFDYELSHAVRTSTVVDSDSLAYRSYLWNNVADTNTVSFIIIQRGNLLLIHKPDQGNTVSANAPVFTVDLNTYKAPGAPDITSRRVGLSQGGGVLFVTHPYCDPLVVEYNSDKATFTTTAQNLLIRDFKGIEDGFRGDNIQLRPNIADANFNTDALRAPHKYNLYNQGWYTTVTSKNYGFGTALEVWLNLRPTIYPSNADVWHAYRSSDDSGTLIFAPGMTARVDLGATPAPRGHYIYNPFYIDRSAKSGIPGLPVETAGYQRPSCSSFYAGRVFWSGVSSTNYGNSIYFSQIVRDNTDYNKCYQSNDPVSSEQADLLSNDGGVIKVLEAAQIVALIPIQNSLFVLATNGVWQIQGSQGLGFTATDYSVSKISGIGITSANSIVDAVGTPLWWNTDGIYTLNASNVGDYGVVSITEQTIKTLYQSFAVDALNTVEGAFSLSNREVLWMWDNGETTKFLHFRVGNNAFSIWEISKKVKMPAIVAMEGFATSTFTAPVVDNVGVTVFTVAGTVTVQDFGTYPLASTFKILLVDENASTYTFGDFNTGQFQDWASTEPEDYSSFFVTGYKVRGDAIRLFQLNFIQLFTDLSEFPNGSCYVSSLWDYGERYSNDQQIYPRSPGQQTTGRTRKQIRGTGEAVQLRFESDGSSPFHIVGWAEFATGNQSV